MMVAGPSCTCPNDRRDECTHRARPQRARSRAARRIVPTVTMRSLPGYRPADSRLAASSTSQSKSF